MKNCFINGMGMVSAQEHSNEDFWNTALVNETESVLFAQQPSYKELIPPAMIRRMAKGVKMGIFASTQAMNQAGMNNPEAIITGTGMGCVEDSEKFLKAILDNKEEFLTPTSFIQSTHNTVGAQIALGLQCKSYNFTYVNGAVSLESALIDAKMQLDAEEAHSVLVGGIDETAQHTLDLFKLKNIIKNEADKPYKVLNSNSKGVVFSEGASFFALENTKKDSSYALVKDVSIYNSLKQDQLEQFVSTFLTANNLTLSDIDTVVLGVNGDVEFDGYYTVLEDLFKTIPQVYYKHLSGEYNTASGFGLWTAAQILKNQHIPEVVKMNTVEQSTFKNVLLYNQYQGKDHSLILLEQC
ncbi:beta-ketoacyl synthase chain length factor [Flavobacterium sp. SM15]|uniref:beta-ketoacyl synthase N-terminal-like domain-containing protein n=1 Tax=Flavobacterium sp. SM15 TaxID=2908005 RepID=UPI001ED9EC35|nr:beta-ketoacyl synthase N-terminal-like domain-containing protein [Flavobacterium sp. SM15]MCG2610958.1 beta-ketoacyl synthase chain length factor [Flavobacterium sp. SM15]